jgi:hypothetical protein
MEEVLAAFAGHSKAEASHLTHSLHSASQQTTSKKHITRRRSVFELANDFFKPGRVDKVETGTPEHEKQERLRGTWNPFVSLRGLRDSKNKTTGFATVRSKSFSPQKKDELGSAHPISMLMNNADFVGVDEFGMRKARRRKSLQDLLGTVGNKFTLSRRYLPGEEILLRLEGSGEDSRESSEASPLVLPEPAMPLPGPPNALLGSLYLYSKDLQPTKALECQTDPAVQTDSEESLFHILKQSLDPLASDSIDMAQFAIVLEKSGAPGMHCHSQDFKRPSPSVSPERLCPTVPIDFLWDVNPRVPAHVR